MMEPHLVSCSMHLLASPEYDSMYGLTTACCRHYGGSSQFLNQDMHWLFLLTCSAQAQLHPNDVLHTSMYSPACSLGAQKRKPLAYLFEKARSAQMALANPSMAIATHAINLNDVLCGQQHIYLPQFISKPLFV